MRLTPLYDNDNRLLAIEFESIYLSRSGLKEVLHQLGDAHILNFRTAFGSEPDVFARFTYRGNQYVVIEPYGDSSRYWCGPEDDNVKNDFLEIKKVFKAHNPFFLRRILGDFLSLISQ